MKGLGASRNLTDLLVLGEFIMFYNFEVYVGEVTYNQSWSVLWMDPDGNEFQNISDFIYDPKMKCDMYYHFKTLDEILNDILYSKDPIPF
jgi:hypothetical protein